jgi:hypothetical protein
MIANRLIYRYEKKDVFVQEDRPWDWDRLFTEVSSELVTEWEKKDAEEGEGEQPAET